MKKYVVIVLCVAFFASSCGSPKVVTTRKSKRTEVAIDHKDGETVIQQVSKNKPVVSNTPEVYASPVEEYIAIYSDIAQDEMRSSDIPASITLAQGILESGSGKGRLATKANNHFGIKCHSGWTGGRIYHDDDKNQECFRAYKHSKYSFRDHSKFLTGRSRYAALFQLKKDDYKAWAKGLRAAGYATDKKYPEKLISLIERYQLYRFDAEVLGTDTGDNQKHVVVKGDTLYSLSRFYGISVKELQDLNSLVSNDLFEGQILFVKPLPKD